MPHYKLTYFAHRGKGEVIRQLFALAGVDYENESFSPWSTEWEKMKEALLYGCLPVLEVDGKVLGQANAIAKYLASEFGFNGANAWEAAQIDAVGVHYEDLFNKCRAYYRSWLKATNQPLDEAYKNSVIPGRDAFFPPIVKLLNESQSGFIIGDKVSWIDLLVADHCETFLLYDQEYLKDYPEVKAHFEKVHSIPEIKKWIAKRPETGI